MLKKTLINLKMLSNKKNFCTLKVNQFFFPICRGMSTKQAKNRNIPNRQNKKKKQKEKYMLILMFYVKMWTNKKKRKNMAFTQTVFITLID